MNRKRWIVVALAALTITGLGVAPTLAARRPRRTQVVPVSKIVQGQDQVVNSRLVQCPDGSVTLKRELSVRGNVASWTCDTGCSIELLLGVLEMKVRITRREGQGVEVKRGCWEAEWQLRGPNGVVAEGTGSGIVNGGTHDGLVDPTGEPQNCERCDIQHHFEGVLVGKSKAPGCKGNFCLSIQGFGFSSEPEQPGTFSMRLEGALITPCD